MASGRRKPETLLFASDVHLPPEDAPGAAALWVRFDSFLNEVVSRAGTLYLLGDLFDYWYESRGRTPRGFDGACSLLADAVARGLKVVVIPGNRDFLLGHCFERATGAVVAPEEVTLSLGGKRVLLTHGDSLATGDRRYQIWRRFVRGPTFGRFVRGMPPPTATFLAAWLRRGSERRKRARPGALGRPTESPAPNCAGPVARPPQAGDVDRPGFSEEALRFRVASGADVVIAGHVHEPGDRVIRSGDRTGRIVTLGSWEKSRGAYAEWDGSRLRLVT